MRLVSRPAVFAVALPSFACLALLSPRLAAQATELYRLDGAAPDANFGFALATVEDVDGDGVAELLVGASNEGGGAGRAYLVSGVNGQPLHDWPGGAYDRLGAAVASAGDLDFDKVPELLVGAPGTVDSSSGRTPGAAYVYSGADGSLLRSYFGKYDLEDFGSAVANLGDLDGDSVDDHAIGGQDASYTASGSGSVYLYSGATGNSLGRIDSLVAFDKLGASISATGDLDLDQVPDLAIGVPFRNANGFGNTGAVYVYSGATRTFLFHLLGDQMHQELGRALAAGVDLDGDGTGDLLVGSPKWNGTLGGEGFVRAYSGATHGLLWERLGTRVDDAMGAAVALADRNGDGVAEVLVSAGSSALDDWRIETLDPATGLLLHQRPDPDGDDQFGAALAILGDANGDGAFDVAAGTPDADLSHVSSDEGVVYVFAGSKLWLNAEPKSAGPGAPLTTSIGPGVPGNLTMRFAIDVSGTPLFLAIPPLTTFDAFGRAVFNEAVPPGLSGLTATLRAYAVKANGRLAASNDETIEFL